MSKAEATRLANLHGQAIADNALLYWSDQAAALLRQWPDGEPVAVHQFRKPGCADWYDGVPDEQDGPAETRTLYTTPPDAAARIAELESQRDALRIALEFAQRAVEDAIYTEDGLDGDAGQRTLHIFSEALEHGTFDKVKYGELPPPMLEVQNAALVDENESLRATLKVAGEALMRCVGSLRTVSPGGDGDPDVECARDALQQIKETQR